MVCYPSVDAFTGLTLWSVAPKLTLNDLGSRHLKIGTKKAHPVFSTAARLHWQQYSKALEVSKPQSLNTWETTLLWESFLEAETCLNPSQWKVKGEKVAMKKLQKVWKVYKMTILAKPYWLWIRRSFHYHIQLYKRTQTEQSHRHIVQTLDAKKHTVRILSQSPWHAKHSMSSGWPVSSSPSSSSSSSGLCSMTCRGDYPLVAQHFSFLGCAAITPASKMPDGVSDVVIDLQCFAWIMKIMKGCSILGKTMMTMLVCCIQLIYTEPFFNSSSQISQTEQHLHKKCNWTPPKRSGISLFNIVPVRASCFTCLIRILAMRRAQTSWCICGRDLEHLAAGRPRKQWWFFRTAESL